MAKATEDILMTRISELPEPFLMAAGIQVLDNFASREERAFFLRGMVSLSIQEFNVDVFRWALDALIKERAKIERENCDRINDQKLNEGFYERAISVRDEYERIFEQRLDLLVDEIYPSIIPKSVDYRRHQKEIEKILTLVIENIGDMWEIGDINTPSSLNAFRAMCDIWGRDNLSQHLARMAIEEVIRYSVADAKQTNRDFWMEQANSAPGIVCTFAVTCIKKHRNDEELMRALHLSWDLVARVGQVKNRKTQDWFVKRLGFVAEEFQLVAD